MATARMRYTLGPFIAYHGCDRSVAESVLSGKKKLLPSVNDYDWLGSGIYFWLDSPERGLDWARELARREDSGIQNPCVIGALIHPGLCLNLTDYGAMPELRDAYRFSVPTELAMTAPKFPRIKSHESLSFPRKHANLCAR